MSQTQLIIPEINEIVNFYTPELVGRLGRGTRPNNSFCCRMANLFEGGLDIIIPICNNDNQH